MKHFAKRAAPFALLLFTTFSVFAASSPSRYPYKSSRHKSKKHKSSKHLKIPAKHGTKKVNPNIRVAKLNAHPTPSGHLISAPWMTGPILAPAGHVVPGGHTNYEPYLFVTDAFGIYNNRGNVHSVPRSVKTSPTMVLTQGLASFMDLQIIAAYNFNNNKRANRGAVSYNGWADPSVMLGFQALTQQKGTWMPDLRVTLIETFPAGRYQNLNPSRPGVEANGGGSYQTGIGLNFQKTVLLPNKRFLRTRLDFTYTMPASTHVTGFNSYGGGFGTSGTVNLGNKFNVDLGLEYTLTQHWVPALDVSYSHQDTTTFSGRRGVTATGMPARIGSLKGGVLSLAPAIEYNFSAALGIIGGAWFSVYGRNNAEFAGAAFALNYYH